MFYFYAWLLNISILKEMIIRTREGTKIPVELSISKVNIDDKVNFMCIIRDISNREKRERELSMQKEFRKWR